ncbi:MAG: hypothetical protein U5R06_16020 [candidate division KSB1 bacterium]|nr:hypothetical protein [candidate division KSB1 bacterium]
MLRHIEFKQTIEEFDYILSFADRHKDPDKLLSASVDFINDFAVRHQHDMVCIFDEFGDLQKLDGTEIIKLFRAKIQQQQATYIFSGSYESVMNDLFISSHAPFYRFARIIKLGCIEKSAFKTYLSHVFKSLQINVEQASLDTILDFTGGHPYYTQLICQQIELEHATERTVKASQIADYIESAMWVEINYIETLWQELSKSRENVAVLVALAENREKIYSKINTKHVNVARAIKRFEKNGIIEKRNKQYTVTDPLFLYWIKRKLLRKNKTECV